MPPYGRIGIFNRSYYEEVLVVKVHPEYLDSQKLVDQNHETIWDGRYQSIRQQEEHLARNGTVILKFWLNVSRDEQRKRFLKRLDEPQKNWKFSSGDLKERKLWDKYQECYQDVLNRTSNDKAPWYIVPADDKATARLIVATTILETLQQHKDIQEPELDEETKSRLEEFKTQLENE